MTRQTIIPICLLLSILATASATLSPAITDRNYYADEVVISNHSYTFGSAGGNMTTRWNTTLGDNIHGIITEDMLAYAATGNLSASYNRSNDHSRIAYVLDGDNGFHQLNSTRNLWFSPVDAAAYAMDISTLMSYYFEGRPFVQSDGVCLSITNKEVYLPVRNSIWLNHWKYPFVHVTELENRWCFDSG